MCSILPAIITALLLARCECQACEAQDRGAFTVRDYGGRVVNVEPRVVGEVQGKRRRSVTRA